MLLVGVTGGIGSGKSLVCNIISAMGYPVYHTDIKAKRLTNTHPAIVEAVQNLFGEDIYNNGELNRKKVAKLVFSNKQLLNKLNAIIHPVVADDFSNWVNQNKKYPILFKEAAILFESGAFKQLDKIIGVNAPKEIRIARVCNRDGVQPNDVERRMANQISDEELIERSDYTIRNDEQELLTPKVVKLLDLLLAQSSQ